MNYFSKSKYFALILFSPFYLTGMSLKDLSAKKFSEYLKKPNEPLNQIAKISSLPIELNNKINSYLIKPEVIAFAIKKYLSKNNQYQIKKNSIEKISTFYQLSPDTKKLALKTNEGIEIYNINDQKFDFLLESSENCKHFSFCPKNSYLLVTDLFQKMRLYNVENGTIIANLTEKNGTRLTVKAAEFSTDGTILSIVFQDNCIHFFAIETLTQSNFEESLPIIALRNTKRYPSRIIWSLNNKLIAAIFRKSLKIYEVGTGRLLFIKKFPGHQDNIQFAFSPNSKYFAISDNYSYKSYVYNIYNSTEQDKPLAILNHGHSGEILRLDFSSDGKKLLEASHDGSICIYNLNNLKCVVTEQISLKPSNIIKNFRTYILDAKFSPDGALAVIDCYDGLIYIYTANSAELLAKLDGHKIFEQNLLNFHTSGFLTTLVGENYDRINIYDLSFADLKEKLFNLNPSEVLLILEAYKADKSGKKINVCSCQNHQLSKYYNENQENFSSFLFELIESFISKNCDKCYK